MRDNRRGRRVVNARQDYIDETRGASGFQTGIFKFPKGTRFFKPKTEKDNNRNVFDIIPYEIKSENHPLLVKRAKEVKIGDLDSIMDIWIHRNIIENQSFVCLLSNYNRPCPICQERDEIRRHPNSKREVMRLTPKRRFLANIKLPGESELYVFDVSYILFMEVLRRDWAEELKESGMQEMNYFDIEDGLSISFRANQKRIPDPYAAEDKYIDYAEFESFKFRKRQEKLDYSYVDKAISFDEIMEVLTYDEMKAAFYGQDMTSSQNTKDEMEEKKQEKNCTIEKSLNELQCPFGHTFGKDNDNVQFKKRDCDNCDVWDKCNDAHYMDNK